MAKRIARHLFESIAEPLYKLYSSSLREWNYKDLKLTVLPGVFHPGWFVTSRMLLERIEYMDLNGKKILELGCGSGAQACRAVQLGAIGYASDVTPVACQNANSNAERNGISLQVIASDIFDNIPSGLLFDYIFVNPPFLPLYPEEERDFAFCCGEGHEYYISLFQDLHKVLKPEGVMIMALAQSCQIDEILAVAASEALECNRVYTLSHWAELNYLYEIRLSSREL